MSDKTGGSAFPTGRVFDPYGNPDGMSLRDYFAAAAMSTLLHATEWTVDLPADEVAELSYHMADAMIEARKQ